MTTLDELFGARAALTSTDVLDPEACAALRASLEQHGYQRYQRVDRGRYDHCTPLPFDGLAVVLQDFAQANTGRTLEPMGARALRLGPGDYLLAHHDRVDVEQTVEVIVDLSATAVPDADVCYRRRGQVFFRLPSAPGRMSLVERGPGVACHHTYVSQRHLDASIVRVVIVYRDQPGLTPR